MISIDFREGRAALEALAPEWDAWVGDTSPYSVFTRSPWYLAWLDAYPAEKVTLITARENGRLVGLVPITRSRTDARGLYMHRVAPLGAGPTDYQPPIIDPARAAEVLPQLLDAIATRYGKGGVVWFANLPESHPGLAALREILSRRDMPVWEEEEFAYRLRVPGLPYPEIEAMWSAHFRKDVRRQRKRLTELGELTLYVPSSLEEVERLLPELFQVHDAKWLSQGYPGMFANPVMRAHYQAMARRLFGRGLHVSTLRCGDTNVSYHFGFLSGGWLQWYRPTYRPEFGKYSPSKVHVSLILEECARQGWQGFDYLLGADAYKKEWTNERERVVSVYAGYSRYSAAFWWFSKGKPWARSRWGATRLRALGWIQRMKSRGAAAPAPAAGAEG